MVLLSFKSWDRTSLDWPGHSNEISLEVLPVRVLLVARLVRRVTVAPHEPRAEPSAHANKPPAHANSSASASAPP